MESESAVLEDYESVLEELTFNSKPIINMLTMKADKYRVYAPAIVELVKTRFFKVRQEYKIPTLYLMDSMIKNLGGDFLEELAKGIVGVFCHAFESMNDPKIRIALYKLRQTWPPYIPVRKLAAIDEHIHAIDPNWPITAQEPSSPTIFLNPKFLESKDEAAAKRRINKITTTATANRDSPPLPKKSILKQRSQQPAASKPMSNSLAPPTIDTKGRRSPQSVGTEKQSSKSSSTVTASSKQSKPQDSAKSPETKRERGGGGDRGGIGSKYHIPKKTKKVQFHSSTTSASPPPSSSSSSPVKPKNSSSPPHSPSSSSSSSSRSSTSSSSRDSVKDKRKKLLAQQRQIKTNKQLSMGILPLPQDDVSLDRVMQKHKRSASPSPEKRHVEPRAKRPRSASPTVAVDTRDGVVPVRMEGDRGRGLTGRKHRSEEIPAEPDENTKRFKMEAKTELVRNEGRGGEGADMMDIKDLIKQQDFMLEQAQKSLESDTLTPDQRDKLAKQVEQLLELQKGSPHVKEERTDKYNESVSRGDDSASCNRDSVSFSHAPVSVSVSHSHDSVSHFRDSVSHSHDFVSHPQESVSRQHDYSYDSVSHSHDSVSHSRDSVSHSRDLGSRSRPPGAEIPPPPQHRTLLPFPPPPRDYIPPQHNFDDFPPPRGPRLPPPPRSNITFTRGQGGKRTRVRRPFRGRHRSPLPPYIMRGGPVEHRVERGGHPPRPPPQENKNMPFVADLYEKLKTSGLLPEKDGGAPPPPTRRIPMLPLIRLNIKELKLVYKDLYMSLHEGEPCTSCGLRFRDDQRDEYQAHLDWHYHENRLDKDGTRATMRNWFLHPDDWVSFEGSLLINQNEPLLTAEQEDNEDSVGAEDKPTGISCKVLPGEDTQVCGVCHEQLEQFWEEDEEEWHFKDALRTPDDALYHSYCYVDSKESLGLLSVESSPISEMPKPLNI